MEQSAISNMNVDEKFVSSFHAKNALEKMRDLFETKQLTDVTLVVANLQITAHRLVLSSASDYFRAMFTNDLKESKMEKVHIENTDPVALKSLVDFCYSGEIDLSEDNVEAVLSTANILQITEVIKACCNFLSSRLHPSNCIGISLFSKSQGCMELHKVAHRYVMDNFTDVIHNQEYLSLPADEVKNLLSSSMLNVSTEQEAYMSLMLWVNNDFPNRKDDFPGLLETIRLPLLSPQVLADNIECNILFKENPACYRLVMEAMEYHLLPERRFLLQSPRTKPRKSTVGNMFIIGGMDGDKGSSQIDVYNLRNDSWTNYYSMTSRRLQFGAAVIEDKLYVVGGRDGFKTLNSVECFDLKTKTWSAVPSMFNHRHGLGVAVLGGLLYAVGGHDGWSFLDSVERWDPSTKKWHYVETLNLNRSTAGVAVLNDRLYAVGGRDGSSSLKSVEYYNPHRNKWTFCAAMSTPRGGPGVGVIDEHLFAFGGHDAMMSRFDSVERYDPRTDSWTLVAPMSVGRDAIGVTVLGNKLIAIGGYDGQSYLKIVEAYDPNTNEWKLIKELDKGLACMCVVVKKI